MIDVKIELIFSTIGGQHEAYYVYNPGNA